MVLVETSPEAMFCVTLLHPHLVPSGYSPPKREGQTGKKKKKKSQNLDFNIDSNGWGENMNLSPFLKVSLLLK